jgi:hypothetical protein
MCPTTVMSTYKRILSNLFPFFLLPPPPPCFRLFFYTAGLTCCIGVDQMGRSLSVVVQFVPLLLSVVFRETGIHLHKRAKYCAVPEHGDPCSLGSLVRFGY